MNPRDAIYHQWKFDVPALSLCLNRNGDYVAIALADGTTQILPASDEAITPKAVKTHEGVSLCLRPDADAHAFLSGGDDGRVVIIDPILGEANQLAEHKNQWIDTVATAADGGLRAYNTSKTIHVLNEDGSEKFSAPLTAPAVPGGLAFSPNSKRLAAAHYNGVSLWWMNAKSAEATFWEWKGAHIDAVWSPDGKSLMTSMQDCALHGWQVADGKEMRMQGYAAKVRSMDWTARAKYLATAGAEQIILWPFAGGGPWGKPPLTLGGMDGRIVTQVASHPKDEMVAAGYSDGMIVLAPCDGRMEIMINTPMAEKGAAITGLGWNTAGDALFACAENGVVLLFTIASVRNAVTQS